MIIENKYNQIIVENLVEQFGITPVRAEEILTSIAETILYTVVFKGPVNTPFGKMSMLQSGIQIIEQNKSLQKSLKNEKSQDKIAQLIKDVVSGD